VWLDAGEHGAFTGEDAAIDAAVGGAFTVGDSYIQGKTLKLTPYRKIVQTWPTTDFAPADEDSKLEIVLDKMGDGTRITLSHSNVSDGQGSGYEEGWKEYYFKPMSKYFKIA
jgi:uncharacterized protein YndB with AHSA1/START domain